MRITNSRIPHLPGKMWEIILRFTGRIGKNFEEERRRSVLAFFLIIGILISFPFAIHHFTLGNVTRALILLLVGSIQFTSLMALRFLNQSAIIFRLNIILLGAYFLFLAHLGGSYGSRILWVFIFPLFTFFLLGKKEGLCWSILHYLLSTIIITDPGSVFGTFPYKTAIAIRFLIVYGLVIIMSYVAEATRLRYQEALERDQRKLQEAHDQLERRVEERTAELRQANQTLEAENAERRQAEYQVMQEKTFTEVLINSLPASISMFDDQGRMVRWNKRFEELSGYTNEEISNIGIKILDLMPESDKATVMEAWQKVMQDEKVGFESGGVRKDGSVIPFYYTASRVVVDNQIYVLGSGVDITELKRTEEALQEAYDIISKSPAVAFRWTNAETWPVEFVSVNVKGLFGYTAEDFTSGTVSYLEVIHPEDAPRVAREVSTFSQEEGRERFRHKPYRIVTKDGTIKWVNDSTYIRRNHRGQITHYQGVVEDITEGRQTEMNLRESEERFRALVENSPAGIFLIDDNYRFVYANEELSNILGFSQEELAGMDFRKILDNESRSFVADRYVRRQRGEDVPARYEVGIARKDGMPRRLEMVATAVKSPDGSVRTIGQSLDITNRKRAEEKLRQSSQRLRMALQASRMGTWDWDLRKNLVEWSTETLSIFGISAEEFGGTYEAYLDFTTNDVCDKIDREIKAFLANPPESGIIHYDHPIFTADRQSRWIEMRGTLFNDERGRPRQITGVCADITERKQIEDALRASEKFLQDVFDGIQDGISVLDAELNIVRVNNWMEKMYRFRSPLVGKKCYEAYHGTDYVCPWCPSIHTLKSGKMHAEVIPYRPADQAEGWIELSSFPLKDTTGAVTGVIEHVKDITDRKKAEQELTLYRENLEELVEERTEALKAVQDELIKRERLAVLGQLTAMVSHELRNPLGVIRTSAFYLQMKIQAADDKVKKHLKRIEEQVAHCDSIVDDLLEYTRGRHSKMIEGDLNGWMANVLETFGDTKNIELTTDFQSTLPVVSFDPEKLRRVTVNLVENAIQSIIEKQHQLEQSGIPYRPEIKVSTRETTGGVLIELEDNGIGMDEDTSKRAFEPFFTTKARGTGLGLAVVRKIIEEHQGTVSIESRIDRGLKVSIELRQTLDS